jgi:cell division ATPase FtsA
MYTGIGQPHPQLQLQRHGGDQGQGVSPLDVERVIEAAAIRCRPTSRSCILTQEFIIDGQEGVREPIGMSGVRLEVKVHIVTGACRRPRTSSSACVAAVWRCSI